VSDAPFGESPRDREVEEWLRDPREPAPRPAPRSEYADATRKAFLGAELVARAEPAGSLAGRDARTAASMIEDRLKAAPPPTPARAALRDELRARFMRGELVERIVPPVAERTSTRRGPALRLVLGGLAAAAALWIVARILLPDDPAWRGFRADGEGPVVVDGVELVPRDLSELGGAFTKARTIESRARRLELVRDDDLAVALMPGTRLEVRSDGSDGELRFALLEGEVYLKTVAGYRGPSVVVETDHVDMRMTGTVVGVLKNDELSCICVERGTVEAVSRTGKHERFERDTSNWVGAEGNFTCCPSGDIAAQVPAHIGGLRDFAVAAF
jgi:ferric-dicitrate binding protein FerR (iron transport regulator)